MTARDDTLYNGIFVENFVYTRIFNIYRSYYKNTGFLYFYPAKKITSRQIHTYKDFLFSLIHWE